MTDLEMLIGHWVHSHEEDTTTEKVFRKADYAFPPSRGRDEYNLQPGGVLSATRPGPTDQRQTNSGNWQLDDSSNLVLRLPEGATKQLKIASIEPDRLVITK